jgi:hypothetical protein
LALKRYFVNRVAEEQGEIAIYRFPDRRFKIVEDFSIEARPKMT